MPSECMQGIYQRNSSSYTYFISGSVKMFIPFILYQFYNHFISSLFVTRTTANMVSPYDNRASALSKST